LQGNTSPRAANDRDDCLLACSSFCGEDDGTGVALRERTESGDMKGDDAHGDDGVDSTTDVEGWCGRDCASGEDTVVATASSSSLLPATVPPFLAPDPEEEKMRWM
jgi:hypothetical protein